MRLPFWIAVSLLVACGGSRDAGGRGGPRGEDRGDRREAITVVEVEAVGRGAVADLLVTSGVVESESQADLLPVASGIVVSVHKDEGDSVRKGEVLAVLDNVSLETGAERASADLRKREEDFARIEDLYGRGAVSEREYTEAAYQLEAARTAAREASRSYGETRIAAPFDGVVAIRDIRVGELATSGRRAFQVVDLSRLRVVAALPEKDVSRVTVGQPARLVSAYDSEIGAEGTVLRISPVVDSASGTFRVTIGIEPGQTALRPGQFVSAELEVDRHEEVLVVPREAIVYEDGMPVVFRMIPSEPEESGDDEGEEERGGWFSGWNEAWGKDAAAGQDVADGEEVDEGPAYEADRTPVEVGLDDGIATEILSGLAEGDRIVVVGQSSLRDGARVRTPEMQAEARAREEARRASKEGGGKGGAGAGSSGGAGG